MGKYVVCSFPIETPGFWGRVAAIALLVDQQLKGFPPLVGRVVLLTESMKGAVFVAPNADREIESAGGPETCSRNSLASSPSATAVSIAVCEPFAVAYWTRALAPSLDTD